MRNKNIQNPTWCPGCGAYSMMAAINRAITNQKVSRKDVVICYDIGCSGNMVNLINACAVATLHGRSIPFACGVKSANPELKVIAQAGDGGLLSEGLNHFIHAIQRNDPITLIVNNNQVFGLTAGQQSSATPKGVVARGTAGECQNQPLSVVDLAATVGAGFISRVLENDLDSMTEIVEKALNFNGFSLIEVIQPCKIWANKFPVRNYKKVTKPFKKRLELVGREDTMGLLYLEN
jgi:2-oxoglutarate ferredoxin oxidoreductase subunit beta